MFKGVFYGNSDTEEKLIGSLNGCIGCFNSGGVGWEMIDITEILTGIK